MALCLDYFAQCYFYAKNYIVNQGLPGGSSELARCGKGGRSERAGKSIHWGHTFGESVGIVARRAVMTISPREALRGGVGKKCLGWERMWPLPDCSTYREDGMG